MATGYGVQSWGADSGGGGGGTLPPTVVVRTSLEGISPNDPIILDVLYTGAVGEPLLTSTYERYGIGETAYSPISGFPVNFTNSTVVPITGGLRFTLRRRGGWPATPTFEAA